MTLAVKFALVLLAWTACSANAADPEVAKVSDAVLAKLNENGDDSIKYVEVVSTQFNVESPQSAAVFLDVKAVCAPDSCSDDNFKCFARMIVDETGEQFYIEQAHCLPPARIDGDNAPENQAGQEPASEAVSEPPIEPERSDAAAPCCGFTEDVDTGVAGVDGMLDTALRQVSAARGQRHTALRIVRLQRQVVAGVKYLLTAELAPTVCRADADLSADCPPDATAPTLYCLVEFVEQPWVSDEKTIISNNCTGYNYYADGTDGMAVVPSTSTTAQPPQSNTISKDRLSDLESQILVDPIPDSSETKSHPLDQDRDLLKAVEAVIEPVENVPVASDPVEMDRAKIDMENIPMVENPFQEQQKQQQERVEPLVTKMNVKKNTAFEDNAAAVEPMNNDDFIYRPIDDRIYRPLDWFPSDLDYMYFINSDMPSNDGFQSVLSNNDVVDDVPQEIEAMDYTRLEKRSVIPGGVQDESTDHPEALQYAKEGLKLFEADSGHANKLKVRKILKATSQVVAGSLWKIKAEVVATECARDSPNAVDDCAELAGAEVRVCDFSVWDRPWIKNGRETTVSCENDTKKHTYKSKRSVDDVPVLGGPSKVPTDSQAALDYAQHSLSLFDADSGHSNKLIVRKILSATSQVVAGSKWLIKAEVVASDCEKGSTKKIAECKELAGEKSRVCDFEIWDRSWLPQGRQTTVRCENEAKSHEYRSRRSVPGGQPIPGGPQEQNVDDSQVLEHVKNSLALLDSDSGESTTYTVVRVISASSQVVSGSLWKIRAEIILSDCPKGATAKECRPLDKANSKICNFEIWDQPWLPEGKQTKIQCDGDNALKKYRSKRGIKGGITSKPTDSSEAWTYVKDALKMADSDSEHANRLKVRKIVSVTSQVVAGTKWTIRAEIVVSDCPKGGDARIEDCAELKDAQARVCEFVVWDRPWLPKRETTVRCENDAKEVTYKSKRSVDAVEETLRE